MPGHYGHSMGKKKKKPMGGKKRAGGKKKKGLTAKQKKLPMALQRAIMKRRAR